MQLLSETSLQGGKYKIEKVLGQGGFGITYLGLQTGLNRSVAIKEFFMKQLRSGIPHELPPLYDLFGYPCTSLRIRQCMVVLLQLVATTSCHCVQLIVGQSFQDAT